jgi:hypothetical protein
MDLAAPWGTERVENSIILLFKALSTSVSAIPVSNPFITLSLSLIRVPIFSNNYGLILPLSSSTALTPTSSLSFGVADLEPEDFPL